MTNRGGPASDYPAAITPVNHVEPVPRRIRAVLGETTVLDTTRALYVWEWAELPPVLHPRRRRRYRSARRRGIYPAQPERRRGTPRLGGQRHPSSPRRQGCSATSSIDGLSDTVRFEWSALDAWFEEDERVFVHPRNPYARVDALRSTRAVRVEVDGVILAESRSPVMVFETGLPTRYYLNRTELDYTHLLPSDTVTECPYKGTTSAYWSVRIGDRVQPDLAWCYDFPTRQLLPIAGLVAFYNEKVDLYLDGQLLSRPQTHFSRSTD